MTDQPPKKRRIARLFATTRRRWALVLVVNCLVLTGIGLWAFWPQAVRLLPGSVQASVLPIEEAGAVLGVTLLSSTDSTEPPPELATTPESCKAAVGPATRAVYGGGWTKFYSATYQDSADVADHVVIQVLGTYPDGKQAGEVFTTLSKAVSGCESATRTAGGASSKWLYEADETTPDTLTWSAFQSGGGEWGCYRQAKLKGSTVLQAAVCQSGFGAPAAAKIAEKFAAKVGQ
ncbi:sensor domain-containing protein [Amycolatopsis sp. cg5]|uniref:sensor domain-containing protein n=1 Tax=Amycolatopsis sp. cg5 TaxID=3238802 RepID=UPI0035246F18